MKDSARKKTFSPKKRKSGKTVDNFVDNPVFCLKRKHVIRDKIINIVVGGDKKIQDVVEGVRFCTSYGECSQIPILSHFKVI